MKDKIHHYENWIFDWSGTLVDDLAMVLDATNHVLEVYGKPSMTRDDFKQQFRLPYIGFYEEILPNVPLPELEDHFRTGFANSAAAGVISPMLPYAFEFLEFLHKRNVRMFILSSMDAQAFDSHAVELGVDHFFEATYAGVLDKRERIHLMLESHQLEADKTVFLGDMTHDIETARHGGVGSIALLTGYQNEQQLLSVDPDYLARDLAELRSMLETPPTLIQ
ncbi:putative phosphatase [Oceaniferula spumae]|uniref:phosphoglycolate phosphatase n=1 Tax=Oceaniferula spumae TaxID=2979115 RepID=A0AAT9FQ20_9BACT